MKRLCALLLMCVAATAQALPEAARQWAPSWELRGEGEMRWFGVDLYRARLWASEARLDFSSPFALELRYSRDFRTDSLVNSSLRELRRLGEDDEQRLARWSRALGQVFPDVRKGESITGVFLPGRGAVFYHQDRLAGDIEDPLLARAFFGIWLDPRTRDPELRAALLGANP